MITDEYDIKRFTLDSYSQMAELFRSAFEVEISQQTFLKKFDTKILGHNLIGFLAIHKKTGEPAAFYGVFPVTVLINGNKVMAAQSGSTMTHKAHQKKGLFLYLARQTLTICQEKNISFLFGQPNQSTIHGFIKMGWKHVDDIRYFDLRQKIKTVPIPKLFMRLGAHRQYLYFARKLLFPYRASVTDFTSTFNCSYGRIARNKNYMAYKKSSDKIFIKIEGAVFWVKLTDILWIGDINDYDQVTERVMKRLKRLAYLLGFNTIRFHFNTSLEAPAFLKTFKPMSAEPSCFYYFPNDEAGTNLLLTGADFDTW